jgi:phosphoglycerol geranylgeranyltransferase
MDVYKRMTTGKRKKFAVLVDPDKLDDQGAENLAALCNKAEVDFLFAGGSLMVQHRMDQMLTRLKASTSIPVVLFPGNSLQVTNRADAILFLSLISGRNAEMLIGKHVEVAPLLKQSNLEIIPTGYMLIESGSMTTALYMSNSHPIPSNKPDVAACTAMAGQMLGLKAIYLDTGSGAVHPVPAEMIAAVKQQTNVPVIVGGGLRTIEQITASCLAGADIIVVGNAIESDPELTLEFSRSIHSIE